MDLQFRPMIKLSDLKTSRYFTERKLEKATVNVYYNNLACKNGLRSKSCTTDEVKLKMAFQSSPTVIVKTRPIVTVPSTTPKLSITPDYIPTKTSEQTNSFRLPLAKIIALQAKLDIVTSSTMAPFVGNTSPTPDEHEIQKCANLAKCEKHLWNIE